MGRVVYLRPEQGQAPPEPFRCGEAGHVWVEAGGRIHRDTRVRLSANSTHALLGHGVVEALGRLRLEGSFESGLPVLLPPDVLEEAAGLLYEADRKTYGGRFEFVAGHGRDGTEYRIRIDNREYQRSLSRLQFLLTSASRQGRAAWMRLGVCQPIE